MWTYIAQALCRPNQRKSADLCTPVPRGGSKCRRSQPIWIRPHILTLCAGGAHFPALVLSIAMNQILYRQPDSVVSYRPS